MDANAGINPIVLLGVRDGGVQFFGARAGANGQDSLASRRAGAVEHGVAVLSELRKVDVGVGVDEPHGVLALCVGGCRTDSRSATRCSPMPARLDPKEQ